MKTFLPKVDEIQRRWSVVDADSKVLGRVASQIATVLMGKDKPIYTDFLDTGAFVVVVNAEKVQLTGNKLEQKKYYSHSRFPGGLKETSARKLIEKKPEKLFELAVRGMLPKNKLGSRMLKRLKVYSGSDHPHQAQQPEQLTV